MEIVKNFIYGICMGTFEVVPGISGGTLAVLLNIYDKLIYSMSHLKEDFKKHFKYLFNIAVGMGAGIYLFSHIISFLNRNYPIETNCFLVGLILGLVPMIFKKSLNKNWKILNLLIFSITFGFMLFILFVSLKNNSNNSTIVNQVLTSLNFLQFIKFVSVGAFASFCLILPGCSGSMIMLVFGIYPSVMEAIKNFNFLILLPVAAGILFGVIFGSKLIHFCFVNFTRETYCAIFGLILGSIFTPLVSAVQMLLKLSEKSYLTTGVKYLNFSFGIHLVTSFVILVVGTIFSYLFSKSVKDSK